MRQGREWSFVLAVLAGIAVRLDQIESQIPLDDEWHALHAVERFGYGHVATHFGWTDYCIPLTLFYKAVSDTVGLSELWLRAPVLFAGIASLVLMPLVAKPWVGRETSTVFVWLLAVSPLHVYFSRYARPYSIALLLSFLALFALPSWRLRGERVWLWVYVGAATLGPYFHLTTLPVVLLPLAIAWAARLAGARGAGLSLPARTLSILTLAVGAGLLALLGPPLLVDHRALLYKGGRGDVHAAMLAGAASLVAGSGRTGVVVALGLGALGGGVALGRRHPAGVAFLAAVAAIALGLPLVTRPVLIELPIVFVRYALVLLPLVLLLVAGGVVSALALVGPGGPRAASVLGPVLAALLVWLGPLPRTHRRPNAWTNHPAFQYSYTTPPCDPGFVPPPFYAQLAREPKGSERLLEAPWLFAGRGNLFHCDQSVHHQEMRIGFVGGVFDGTGGGLPRPGELPIRAEPRRYRFRSFVHLGNPQDVRSSGTTLVILHKTIEKEMTGATTGSGVGIEPWLERCRGTFGPPVYEDDWMAVFRVAR